MFRSLQPITVPSPRIKLCVFEEETKKKPTERGINEYGVVLSRSRQRERGGRRGEERGERREERGVSRDE